jgi:hypothetical protein
VNAGDDLPQYIVTATSASAGTDTISTSTVTVTPPVTTVADDTPTLTATAVPSNYANTGTASAALFSSASVSAVDSGQKVTSIKMTVTGVDGTANEKLVFDGVDISLNDGNTATTATSSVLYSVSVSGSVATITLSNASGLVDADWNSLISASAYKHLNTSGMNGHRTIAITEVVDNGTDNNTTTLSGISAQLSDVTAPSVTAINLGVDGDYNITSAGAGQTAEIALRVSSDVDFSALESALTQPTVALSFATSGADTGVYNHSKTVAQSTGGHVWLVFDYELTGSDSGALSITGFAPGDAADSAGNALNATLPTLTDSLTVAGVLSITDLQGDGETNASGDTILNLSELTTSGDVVITGVAANNASVTVVVGSLSSTVTASGAGFWTSTLAGLTDGAKTAVVSVGSQSIEYGFTIDRVASIDITNINGANTADNADIAALSLRSISGTTTSVEAGRSVAISVGDGSGTASASAVVQADGSWSTTIDLSSYANGESLTFDAVVSDEAGNSATNSTVHIIDAVAPILQSATYNPASGSEKYILTFDSAVYGTSLNSAFSLSANAGTLSSAYVNASDRTQVIIELSAVPTTSSVTINLTDTSALTDLAGNAVIGTDSDATSDPDVTINLGSPQVLINGVLGINSNESITITESIFSAYAYAAEDTELVFTANLVTNGQFELTNNQGNATTSFTLADVKANRVVFVSSTSESPTFELAVTYGLDTSAFVSAQVRYGELPAVQLAAHYNGRDADGDGDTTDLTNGASVTSIVDSDITYLEDQHSSDIDIEEKLAAPSGVTYNANGINGHGALDFSVATLGFEFNSTALENAKTEKRGWGGVFKTGNDVSATQVIYEEGGALNGYSIVVIDGHLLMSLYNGADGQTRALDLGLVNANTTYSFLNYYDSDDGVFRGYINGVLSAELDISFIFNGHSDTLGLGRLSSTSTIYNPNDGQLHNVSESTTVDDYIPYTFKGLIGEVFLWGTGDINDSQIDNINNYLINRWDIETAPLITITDDVISISGDASASGNLSNALSRTVALNPLDASGVSLVKDAASTRLQDSDSGQVQSLTVDATNQQSGDALRVGSTEIDLGTSTTINFDFAAQGWQAVVDSAAGSVVFSTQSGQAAADSDMESLLEALVFYTSSVDDTDRSVELFVTDADGNSSNSATVTLTVASSNTVVEGFSAGADTITIDGLGFSIADGSTGIDLLSVSVAGSIALGATNGVQDLHNIEGLDVANGLQNDLTLSDLFVKDANSAAGLQIDLDTIDTLTLSAGTGSWAAAAQAIVGYDAYSYSNEVDSSDDYTLYVTVSHAVLL